MESLAELERGTKPTTPSSAVVEAPTSQNKLSYEARKEQSKAIKKAEKAVSDAEARIAALEKEIADIETRLATPEGAADTSLYTDYAARKQALSDTMDEWTERQMELEELVAAQG